MMLSPTSSPRRQRARGDFHQRPRREDPEPAGGETASSLTSSSPNPRVVTIDRHQTRQSGDFADDDDGRDGGQAKKNGPDAATFTYNQNHQEDRDDPQASTNSKDYATPLAAAAKASGRHPSEIFLAEPGAEDIVIETPKGDKSVSEAYLKLLKEHLPLCVDLEAVTEQKRVLSKRLMKLNRRILAKESEDRYRILETKKEITSKVYDTLIFLYDSKQARMKKQNERQADADRLGSNSDAAVQHLAASTAEPADTSVQQPSENSTFAQLGPKDILIGASMTLAQRNKSRTYLDIINHYVKNCTGPTGSGSYISLTQAAMNHILKTGHRFVKRQEDGKYRTLDTKADERVIRSRVNASIRRTYGIRLSKQKEDADEDFHLRSKSNLPVGYATAAVSDSADYCKKASETALLAQPGPKDWVIGAPSGHKFLSGAYGDILNQHVAGRVGSESTKEQTRLVIERLIKTGGRLLVMEENGSYRILDSVADKEDIHRRVCASWNSTIRKRKQDGDTNEEESIDHNEFPITAQRHFKVARVDLESANDDSDEAEEAIVQTLRVGSRIEVFWDRDERFFPAEIKKVVRRGRTKVFVVHYDDGYQERVDLTERDWRLLESPAVSEGSGDAKQVETENERHTVNNRIGSYPDPPLQHLAASTTEHANASAQNPSEASTFAEPGPKDILVGAPVGLALRYKSQSYLDIIGHYVKKCTGPTGSQSYQSLTRPAINHVLKTGHRFVKRQEDGKYRTIDTTVSQLTLSDEFAIRRRVYESIRRMYGTRRSKQKEDADEDFHLRSKSNLPVGYATAAVSDSADHLKMPPSETTFIAEPGPNDVVIGAPVGHRFEIGTYGDILNQHAAGCIGSVATKAQSRLVVERLMAAGGRLLVREENGSYRILDSVTDKEDIHRRVYASLKRLYETKNREHAIKKRKRDGNTNEEEGTDHNKFPITAQRHSKVARREVESSAKDDSDEADAIMLEAETIVQSLKQERVDFSERACGIVEGSHAVNEGSRLLSSSTTSSFDSSVPRSGQEHVQQPRASANNAGRSSDGAQDAHDGGALADASGDDDKWAFLVRVRETEPSGEMIEKDLNCFVALPKNCNFATARNEIQQQIGTEFLAARGSWYFIHSPTERPMTRSQESMFRVNYELLKKLQGTDIPLIVLGLGDPSATTV